MSQIDKQGWTAVMGEIQRTERQMPKGETWAVAATQGLANLIVDFETQLGPERRALLIGIAAMISREANREIMAALQAELVLRRAALA